MPVRLFETALSKCGDRALKRSSVTQDGSVHRPQLEYTSSTYKDGAMTRSKRYPAEVRERAMRLVREHRDQYTSEWAAITSSAEKCGMDQETLRK